MQGGIGEFQRRRARANRPLGRRIDSFNGLLPYIGSTKVGLEVTPLTLLDDGIYRLELDLGLIRAADDDRRGILDDDGEEDGVYGFEFRRLFGDFNGDRVVNEVELGEFILHFRSRIGDPRYEFAYDLDGDGDGDVDPFDYEILRRRFGSSL